MPGACISPGKMIQFHLRGDCIGFPDVVPDLLRYWRTGADFLYINNRFVQLHIQLARW